MVFKVRKLVSREDVSEYLKNLRESRGLTAEDVAKELKIPLHFIKALENGGAGDLSRDIYARKYLDAYLRFLGEEAAILYPRFPRGDKGKPDLTGATKNESGASSFLLKSINKKSAVILSHSLKKAGIFILIILFFGYLSFQFYEFFKAPKLEVYFPPDNSVVHEPLVVVEGKTESETPLYINGTEVMLSRDGAFREEIGLQKGANIIKIEAVKRYGGKSIIFKKVLFE